MSSRTRGSQPHAIFRIAPKSRVRDALSVWFGLPMSRGLTFVDANILIFHGNNFAGFCFGNISG